MNEIICENKNILYGIFMLLLGIYAFLFMKWLKKGEDPKDVGSFDQSVRFGIYLGGSLGIFCGIMYILKEIFR